MGTTESNERESGVVESCFHFRQLEEEDIPTLVSIEELSFTTPWTKEAFEQELNGNELAHYTVVTRGEKVVGYGGLWVIVDEAHVTNIAVHPDFRGLGLGERLMSYMMTLAAVKGAERMTLEVRPSNRPALNLYHKLGFVHEGTRKKYYSDNFEDAWIMWVNLQ